MAKDDNTVADGLDDDLDWSLDYEDGGGPCKTLTEIAAEHPEWKGLAQLAEAERMANPPPGLEGLALGYRKIREATKH